MNSLNPRTMKLRDAEPFTDMPSFRGVSEIPYGRLLKCTFNISHISYHSVSRWICEVWAFERSGVGDSVGRHRWESLVGLWVTSDVDEREVSGDDELKGMMGGKKHKIKKWQMIPLLSVLLEDKEKQQQKSASHIQIHFSCASVLWCFDSEMTTVSCRAYFIKSVQWNPIFCHKEMLSEHQLSPLWLI